MDAPVFPFNFQLVPAFEPEYLHENIRSSLARDLPVVAICRPHEHVMSIAAGGPSLADTYKELTGHIAAVNGSLGWLLDHGVVPDICGVCDPSPHMVDLVAADPRVTYFLASIVHPAVYDKLLNAGCHVVRWNSSSVPGGEAVLDELEPGHLTIGGGSTMGLRWLTLGYTCGFRRFHIHGMDSSFRIDPDRGKASHAYPDHQDAKDWIVFDGFHTRPNFLGQVADFVAWLERLTHADVEPVDIRVFGEGLLQKTFARWKEQNPGMHEGRAKDPLITDDFLWPMRDVYAQPAILEDAKSIPKFMAHVHDRRVCVQAGGNVGVYPAHLAQYFLEVHTFEPDSENYRCLGHNITLNRGRIVVHHAALGEADGWCRTERVEADNIGAVRVVEGDGDVPMRRIDSLHLQRCDLIWLDVEGHELPALKGAAETIDRCRPAVIVEEKGIAEGPRQWLEARGYKRRVQHSNDILYVPA